MSANFIPSGNGPSESPRASGQEVRADVRDDVGADVQDAARAEGPSAAARGLLRPSLAALRQAPTAGQTYRLYDYAGPRMIAVRTVTSGANTLHPHPRPTRSQEVYHVSC